MRNFKILLIGACAASCMTACISRKKLVTTDVQTTVNRAEQSSTLQEVIREKIAFNDSLTGVIPLIATGDSMQVESTGIQLLLKNVGGQLRFKAIARPVSKETELIKTVKQTTLRIDSASTVKQATKTTTKVGTGWLETAALFAGGLIVLLVLIRFRNFLRTLIFIK